MEIFGQNNKVERVCSTMDANHAAAHVSYAYSEISAVYPITPSSPMAELCDEWSAGGKKNIFGKEVKIVKMQSEAGAAGVLHGALLSGALASTFSASQGLLLMLPNIYRIAGELLPGVIHVASRTIAVHALSIFGDHSDIYACRQTGAAMLCESSVQEVMDLSPLAHICALKCSLPFINFFDGFRTSHELQKIYVWDYSHLNSLFPHDALENFRRKALCSDTNRIYGSAQDPNVFFQAREAANPVYDSFFDIAENELEKINAMIGTDYGLLNYYGDPDASHVIIAMGSVCETIREFLSDNPGQKYGLINIHLYRPFPKSRLIAIMPETVKKITVLTRSKEPGAPGAPLYEDVCSALIGSRFGNCGIFSGIYGLASKDTTPSQIAAVYANTEKKHFTIGIDDDVTHKSLTPIYINDSRKEKTFTCKLMGLGGDGTISASKNLIKIIGNHSPVNVQGYFEYDSKKSGGLTISHLRFSNEKIHSAYLISKADLLVSTTPVYLNKFELTKEISDGGSLLVNSDFSELEKYLSPFAKKDIFERNLKIYVIDASKITNEIGLNGKISTVMQAAFFYVSGLMPLSEAESHMKEFAQKNYKKAGEKVFMMNCEAIERGIREVRPFKTPNAWGSADAMTDNYVKNALHFENSPKELIDFVSGINIPLAERTSKELPVSAFLPYRNGVCVAGSSAYERRKIANNIPCWISENCIQCTRCSFSCPHSVIRPVILSRDEFNNAPSGFKAIPVFGSDEYFFSIIISAEDCTGCGACVGICPGKGDDKKSLKLLSVNEYKGEQDSFDYAKNLRVKRDVIAMYEKIPVKSTQFAKPLLEFPGACSGCGETPYVKLLTQIFGSKLYIANATGCSSIWANSFPSCAYTCDENGISPAWSNSLFEDAAEFGLGMLLGSEVIGRADSTIQWVIGGDGFAYDIGFGGLDHIIASGENINILVLNTECYSNTGGQASKATPLAATAKFAIGGKRTKKKDLASMMMTYGDVYVAQIAMGADMNQTVTALREAAEYPGPSLVIAYATCIAHGIKNGMGSTMHEENHAVKAGYFNLFRYNPMLSQAGKNPFIIDSPGPTEDFMEFLEGETRYQMLMHDHPEISGELMEKAHKNSVERYKYLEKLRQLFEP